MPQLTIIAATTDAVATKQQFHAGNYRTVIFSANNLAGAEEADIFKDVLGTWVTVTDRDGNVQKLTATVPMLALEGGPNYGITKDATAGACAIAADVNDGVNT